MDFFKLIKEYFKNIKLSLDLNGSVWSTMLSKAENFSTNHKYMASLSIFIFWFILGVFFYMFLYRCLNLKRSIFSFMFFMLFNVIFFCYIKGLKYLHTFNMPIYIEDLSLFSIYRYFLLSMCVLFALLVWILGYFFVPFQNLFSIIKYPYMKEEIRKILYTWNRGFMGNLCNFCIKRIVHSPTFYVIYFSLHFFIFYFLRSITLCFLFNFAFLHGDLRFFIYSLPLLFFIWFLSFFDYYFAIFREGTANYVCDILAVRYEGSREMEYVDHNVIKCDTKDLSFTLTEEGLKNGFTIQDLDHLKRKWYDISNLTIKFRHYERIVFYFGIAFFTLNCSCWFTIAYYFLMQENINIVKASFFFGLSLSRRTPFLIVSKLQRMCTPREAYFLEEGHAMNEVKNATGGAVSPGHPVVGEKLGDQFRIDAALIHGKGQHPHNSEPLNNTGIPPDKKAINAIALPKGSVFVSCEFLKNPAIPNSQTFLEQPEIKAKLDALSNINKETS